MTLLGGVEPPADGGTSNLVVILDYGSQYTHLITRRIRQLSILSLCISGTCPLTSISELRPRAVVLSGGPHSVHVDGAPFFPDGFLEFAEANGVHVLGICYGMPPVTSGGYTFTTRNGNAASFSNLMFVG